MRSRSLTCSYGADDLAQLDRRLVCPPGNHFHAFRSSSILTVVNPLFFAYHLLLTSVSANDGLQRTLKLRFDQTTHRQQTATQVFEELEFNCFEVCSILAVLTVPVMPILSALVSRFHKMPQSA